MCLDYQFIWSVWCQISTCAHVLIFILDLFFYWKYNFQLSEKSCIDCLDTSLNVCKMTGLSVEYLCMKLLLEIWICDTNFRCEKFDDGPTLGHYKNKKCWINLSSNSYDCCLIAGWICAKRQGCKWNISVLNNSLKTGFVVFRWVKSA